MLKDNQQDKEDSTFMNEYRNMKALLDHVPSEIIMYKWDRKDLKTLYINNSYQMHYGNSLIGGKEKGDESDSKRIHPDDVKAYQKAIIDTVHTTGMVDSVYRIWNTEKKCYCWTKINAVSERLQDGSFYIYAMYSDVTEQKNTEISLEKNRHSLEILLSCIHKLNSNLDFASTLNQVMDAILSYYHANCCYVFEFDWNNNTVTNTYERCTDGVDAENSHLKNIPTSVFDAWIKKFKKMIISILMMFPK